MKKFVLVLVIILTFGGLIAVLVQSGELGRFFKTNPSATLKCSYATHACESVVAQSGTGNYKITITVDGRPAKGIEVDLGVNQGPAGDSYINTTGINGIANFAGLPAGEYYQAVNLENFPKDYGNAYKTWTWSKVTIIGGKTTEMKMDLHTSP